MTRFGSPMAMTVAEDGSEAETQQVRPKRLLWMLGEPPVASPRRTGSKGNAFNRTFEEENTGLSVLVALPSS